MYVFWSLSVKALVTNLEKYAKQILKVFPWSIVTFYPKMIFIKFVSSKNHTFINSHNPLFGLKFKKKCR